LPVDRRTSRAYLQLCQDAGYRPAEAVDPARLRAVLFHQR
jgi:hypothetical protein